MVLLIYVGDRSRLIHPGFGGLEAMVLVERRYGGTRGRYWSFKVLFVWELRDA